MSKKESGLRRLLKAIKEGSRESFLVPIQSHQKLSLLPFCRRKEPAPICIFFSLLGQILEFRKLRPPEQIDGSNGAVSLLGNDNLSNIGILRILMIIVVPVEEHNHIRILLDGSRLSKIRQHRPVIRPGLTGTGQLG